jgi:hypothetical protein
MCRIPLLLLALSGLAPAHADDALLEQGRAALRLKDGHEAEALLARCVAA